MDKQILQKIQIVVIIVLVGTSVGYVGIGAFHYGFDSAEGKELYSDLKLIVVAGTLAAFALIGLGRRASEDKS